MGGYFVEQKKISSYSKKAIIKNISLYLISALVFFLCSGRINVLRGWIYYILVISGAVINNCILVIFNPEVLDSRAEEGSNTKSWDKIILGFYFLSHIVFITGVSGLDVRYGWSQLTHLHIPLGVLLYVISLYISTWAMVTNKHFERTVRLQNERNHKVVDKGPYQYIRHPGNLGMILASCVQPLVVGSVYAFIPSIFAAVLVVVRTKLEDEMLQKELYGYKAYTEIVKYRLIPKVW